jgi:hypothetical protein
MMQNAESRAILESATVVVTYAREPMLGGGQ